MKYLNISIKYSKSGPFWKDFCLISYVLSCPTCHVTHLIVCPACLVSYVLSCPTCLFSCVLPCLTLLVSHVHRALRVLVPTSCIASNVPCALCAFMLYEPFSLRTLSRALSRLYANITKGDINT